MKLHYALAALLVAHAHSLFSAIETTFAMIKPDAVKSGYAGLIIDSIQRNGFEIIHMRQISIDDETARQFYAEHKGKPFFKDLVAYITSGPSIVLELKKDNAVADWRELIGATDPKKARMGTIRKMYGQSMTYNAVHGSDSVASGQKESAFFFKK